MMAQKKRRQSARDQRAMIDGLCRWFARNARDLPWRRRRTGYTSLVSEAMLQQTQVSRVIEPYRRFMRRFPSVKVLAAANEQNVLAMWQGLGYYRRARNLHAAARMIVKQFGGRVPRSAKELQSLSGVGRYTAGAISSIAFNERAAIVDGNVQRVLARVFGRRGFKTDAARSEWAWRNAERLVKIAPKPGVFNEALMELGATVCLPAPAKPKCDKCPLNELCVGRQNGVDRESTELKRATPRAAHHHAVIIRNDRTGKILIEQRPATGMWSNMWQVPTAESAVELPVNEVRRRLAIETRRLRRSTSFKHNTTHRRITFHVFEAKSDRRVGRWCYPEKIDGLPMSNAQRKIVEIARGSGTV